MRNKLATCSTAGNLNFNANYLKAGDTLRAPAIGMLLEKHGVPVNDLIARLNKAGDA